MNKLYIFLVLVLFLSCDGLNVFESDHELEVVFKNNYTHKNNLSCQDTLTIVVWNIQMGFKENQNAFNGNDVGGTPTHMDSLIKFFRDIEADIIILQEVGNDLDHTIVKNQTKYIADKLQYNFAYGDYSEILTGKNVFIRGKRGHAIITRFLFSDIQNQETLSLSRYDRRTNFFATINSDGCNPNQILLNSVHFASSSTIEEFQLQTTRALSNLNENLPTIYAGDFNDDNFSSIFKEFDSHGLYNFASSELNECSDSLLFKGTTGSPRNNYNGVLLDHILISDGLKFYSTCLGPRYTWDLSNHKPIICKISLE